MPSLLTGGGKFLIGVMLLGHLGMAQDSIYFKNFVRHSEGDFCEHTPPYASFQVHISRNPDWLLLENAPRLDSQADPNIPGSGVFGVELSLFPDIQVGDTVTIRFTCNATHQQGTLSAEVTSLPWFYFPTTLSLRPQDYPDPPEDISLHWTEEGTRELVWTPQPSVQYVVYRRTLLDTVKTGESRYLYHRLGRVSTGTFLDTTRDSLAHGYVLIPVVGEKTGPHSAEVGDYPPAPEHVKAAVQLRGDSLGVSLSWTTSSFEPGQQFRIYRGQRSHFPLRASHLVAVVNGQQYTDWQVLPEKSYYYRIVAVNAHGVAGPASLPVAVQVIPPPGKLPDLDITFISRRPRYPRFEVEYGPPPGYNPHLKPGTENLKHYPDSSEIMTYTAHIQNSGSQPATPFWVQWWVNGALQHATNFDSLFPGQEVTSSFHWRWGTSSERLECRVIPQDSLLEITRKNNHLTIFTHALAFHFYVEEGLQHLFATHRNPKGSFSFADWAQVQVAQLNQFFRQAHYPPFASSGIPESVFLDSITVVPDGQLPDWGSHTPDDVRWDGQWGFTSDSDAVDYFTHTVLEQNGGMDWALLHELGHQLGLIDLYNMDVQESEFQVIEPRTGEKPHLKPVAWDVLYYCSRHNYLMHTNFQNGFSDHSAGALTRNAGKRRGFYGEYLADIPKENIIRFFNDHHKPVRRAQVWVYQMQDNRIPNIVKYRGWTDAKGCFLFPHQTDSSYYGGISTPNPFSSYLFPEPNVVGTNAVLFFRVVRGDSVGYAFMDICDFNVAYWSGQVDTARYDVVVPHWENLPASGILSNREKVPLKFQVQPAFPNPFNPSLAIVFTLTAATHVDIRIYDVQGRIVWERTSMPLDAGRHVFHWNGCDKMGRPVPSGTYFIMLEDALHHRYQQKVIKVR